MAIIEIDLQRQGRNFLGKDIDEGGFLRVLHSNFAPLQVHALKFLPPPLDSSAPPVPINNDLPSLIREQEK